MSGPDDDGSHAPTVAATLSTLVDRYGPALLGDAGRLKMLLDQACPAAGGEVAAVLAALAIDVPQQLLAAHGDADLAALLPRLVDGVAGRPGIERAAATRAVRTWSLALALPADGLDRGATVAARAAGAPVAVAFDYASIMTPLAAAPAPTKAPPAAPFPAPPPPEPRAQTAPIPSSPPHVAPPPPAPIVPKATVAAPAYVAPVHVPPPASRLWRRLAAATAMVAILATAWWWHLQPQTAPDAAKAVASTGVSGRLEPPVSVAPPPVEAVAANAVPVDPSTVAAAAAVTPTPPVASVAPPPMPAPAPAPVPAAAATAADRGAPRTPRRVVDVPPPARREIVSTSPCTQATCGSVVAVREIENGAFEVTVRMDDRSIETIRQKWRASLGTRLRKSGERYVPTTDE